MHVPRPSSAVFAAILIAIGIWGFHRFDFVAIWAPGIQPQQLRPPMVVACSMISIVVGVGLLWWRSASGAAWLFFAFLCIWLAWSKGLALIHAPAALAAWESAGETAVLVSAALALAGRSNPKHSRPNIAKEVGVRCLYGLALLAFGASHVAYVTLTASLVPPWLPWHAAWVHLTAATYVAAGIALLAGRLAQPAATLAALQMALFGVLVWLPKIAGGARDFDTLDEAAISFALAASGWVIASALKRLRAEHADLSVV